jgi:hypothetical protein
MSVFFKNIRLKVRYMYQSIKRMIKIIWGWQMVDYYYKSKQELDKDKTRTDNGKTRPRQGQDKAKTRPRQGQDKSKTSTRQGQCEDKTRTEKDCFFTV